MNWTRPLESILKLALLVWFVSLFTRPIKKTPVQSDAAK
jgi:hypothetical protein